MKETILLTKKDSGKPFVTKRGKNYYVEGVKYTDDVKLLLNAVKTVKAVDYNALNNLKNRTSKEKMWKTYFNYQWNEGGLILWHNPTKIWQDELTRQGKLFCQKCGTKMRMYYKSYCPICDGFKKTKKDYQYHHMIDYIEAKYNIDTGCYANSKFKVKCMFSWNTKHQFKWENKNFPLMEEFRKNPAPGWGVSEEGRKFLDSKEGRDFSDKMRKAYEDAPDGKCKEIPYWNFWHFMIEEYWHGDISNDCIKYINWKDVRDVAKEEWQKELTDLFVKEFGDKTYKVEISW